MAAVTSVRAHGRHPWHEALELGGERELWVHAASWPELVAQAGCAVGEQLLDGTPTVPSGRWRELEVEGGDYQTLLAGWLNELLSRAEAEWWVPVEFAAVRATATSISAQARGVRLAQPPTPLKAAAEECVRVGQTGDGFEAKIMLTA